MKKTLQEAIRDLQEGEYLYIYDSTMPIGIRRTRTTLEELIPTNIYRGWGYIKDLKELDKFKDTPWRVFKGIDDFWLEFRHDYLEPALEETILSDDQVNYKPIKEHVDEFSGQAVDVSNYRVLERYKGYYFVGATYAADDFYWLYWNPTERTFKFSSCVGPIERLDPTKTLNTEQIRNLREDIKYIHDAPFPSDLLLSPLG